MKNNYLCLCLCLLCITFLVFIIIKSRETYTHILKHSDNFNTNVIPKKVMQTYFDISKIPQKVYNNISMYANGFDHIIYDDNSALSFLDEFYSKDVVNAFNKLQNGAHKADLLRYCLLYIYGGIYLDIKTELITPLTDIFYSNSDIDIYVVLMHAKDGIYNGVIAAKPRNKIFLELIDHVLHITSTVPNMEYETFIRHFLVVLSSNIKTPITLSKTLNSEFGKVYFFHETCTGNESDCPDGLDRYSSCCYIYDNDKKIIKVRYSDYPWK